MSTDVDLVRAHFESALSTLTKLNDITNTHAQQGLIENARIAHGAGLRRLSRIAPAPWLGETLYELRLLEERVQRAIARAESDERTTPYFMMPAVQ